MSRTMSPMIDPRAIRNPDANPFEGLGVSDVAANQDWYYLVFDWTSTVAAGATSNANVTVDAAGSMIVTHFLGTFFTVGTIGSSVAGTQLPADSDPSSASNQLPNLAHLSVLISSRSWQWSNNPMRANLLLSNGRNRNWFAVNPKVAPLEQITIALTNGAAVGVQGQICMGGYRIR